ncbi:MAG TPA: hypothetical protein VK629_09410 [Steroidobacteraceae bacterium]|nr:hypothetical protein [Steroidobacteraceae bacterium]
MRLQKTLLIAVLVLGVASLIYWAKVVKNYEAPAATPADAAAPAVVEQRSASVATPPVAPTRPLPETTAPTSSAPARASQSFAPSVPTQRSSSQSTTATPEPIPSTPGHTRSLAFMRQMNVEEPFVKLHDKLSAEGRDPDWAYAMEQTLGNFFLSRSSQLGIEVPTIVCRTSGCEVQMTTTQKPPLFNQLTKAAQEEPWYATFTPHQGPTSVFNGVEYFWLILKRK